MCGNSARVFSGGSQSHIRGCLVQDWWPACSLPRTEMASAIRRLSLNTTIGRILVIQSVLVIKAELVELWVHESRKKSVDREVLVDGGAGREMGEGWNHPKSPHLFQAPKLMIFCYYTSIPGQFEQYVLIYFIHFQQNVRCSEPLFFFSHCNLTFPPFFFFKM